MLVATAKFHSEEQELAAGTKQSSQADKADRLTRKTGSQDRQADKADRLTRQTG